jgi:acyl carrier protein
VPARVIRRIEGKDRAFLDGSATSNLEPRTSTSTATAATSTAATSTAGGSEVHASDTVAGAATQANGTATAPSANAHDELDARVRSLIAATFSLEGPVEASWGPKEIPKWDSLGQLRLTFSLEETFKINISETQLTEMTTVGDVCRVVRTCLAAGT